jgi:hypothetical protein
MKNVLLLFVTCAALSMGHSTAQVYQARAEDPNVSGLVVTQICLGQSVRLFGNGESVISWYDGTTLLGPNNMVVTPAATGPVSYTARAASGGTATLTITVNAGSAPAAPVITTTSAACTPAPVVLTATGCNGTVKWYRDIGFSFYISAGPDGASLTISSLPTQTLGYAAICADAGCVSAGSNVIGVGPGGLPPDAPVVTASATTICRSTSAVLTATGCSSTINWYINPGGSVVGSGTSFTVSPAATTTYYARCGTGNCVSLASNSVAINVTQPTAVVAASATGVVTPVPGSSFYPFVLTPGCELIGGFSTSEPIGPPAAELYGQPVRVAMTIRPALGGFQNGPTAQRYYQVQPVNALSSGYNPYFSIRAYFTQAEFDAFNAVSSIKFPINATDAQNYRQNVRIVHVYNNGAPPPAIENPANRVVSWDAALNHWVVAFNTIAFGSFYLTAENAISLPVTWAGFSVRAEGASAVLDWQTATEINNSHFEVERSRDARAWDTIGQVAAKAADAQPRRQYQFIDAAPGKGIRYYRLRQVDIDGTTDYSQIKSVTLLANPELSIGPVPTDNHLSVRGVVEPCQARIVDLLGRPVLTQTLTQDTDISIGPLAAGVYLLHLTDDAGTTTRRFVKL